MSEGKTGLPGVPPADLPKDLIDLDGLSERQITTVLDTAMAFREVSEREIKKVPTLRGKLAVLLFHENSTRTRLSFEIAAKRLSADTLAISASGSSMSKGETLLDTAKNILAMRPDALVVRHSASGVPKFLGDRLPCPVLNAGDGAHAHPTQALLDLLTLRIHKGRIRDLDVAVVGDIAHSRVARSDMVGLRKMGAKVRVAGPPSMLVPGLEEEYGVKVYDRIEPAVEGADAVIMLRVQLERQKGSLFPSSREYARVYGMNLERLKLLAPDGVILHPGPVNQGVEMTPEVFESGRSLILRQVTNGVAVRMALLYLMVESPEGPPPEPRQSR
ncbi:MAG: aspartate carbamoyltransferase catalytic subunit [Deltaproteobacteria bacterium]|jgi:aspartate carbamoyltransferase catalytic subunit|nr:aspartate carbamoyltransferase catalytic subunit [Deltaproteobacteria bacterium]